MKPYTVRLAAYLCVTGLAGSLLVGVLDSTPMPEVPPDESGILGFAMGMVLILGIALTALVLWIIWKAYSRRNWARIFLLAFTVLGAVLYLPYLPELWRVSPVLGLGNGFFLACEVGGAALFFAPEANRWFNVTTA